MGDHQNGPSRSAIIGMDLHQLIQLSPEDFLGKQVLSKFKTVQLPFLFKILSFDKALPLQSHPNRKLGEQLMKQEKSESWLGKNETYVDPNHKPEVAAVLSEKFQGFVGFRPIEEIQDFVRDVPELRSAIGETMAEEFLALQPAEAEKKLKDTFGRIFDDEKSKGSHLVDSFIRRVKAEGNDAFGKARGSKEGDLAEVATKLYIHYPGDIGIFGALFFSNLVVLKRGEGIAIQPDVLHAYVEGDVIEVFSIIDLH
jgi:mannose-6-phosphate isomerase